MAGPEVCLACSASARDALDLLEAQMRLDGDPQVLIDGMDRERMWRVLAYMAGYAGSLVDMCAALMEVPAAHVVKIIREVTEEERHEH